MQVLLKKRFFQIQNCNDILTIKHLFMNETMKNMITFKASQPYTLVNLLKHALHDKSTAYNFSFTYH